MGWTFQREESGGFDTRIPEGKHRIRISSAEKAVSKTGNDMLVLQFEVSGYAETLYHYIVFLEDRPEITNRNLTRFFDSFKDIREGDLNLQNWIGKAGACTIKHEEYNGNTKAKVGVFIEAGKQGDLPPWKSAGGGAAPGAMPADENFTTANGDDDLPF